MKRIFSGCYHPFPLLLFTDIASEMLYPVMPIYLKSIGFTLYLSGYLKGLPKQPGLSKGYFGELSDRLGKRVIFIRWVFPECPFQTYHGYQQVAGMDFYSPNYRPHGQGLRTSARDALLSDESTPETRGKVFGFHRAWIPSEQPLAQPLLYFYSGYIPATIPTFF